MSETHARARGRFSRSRASGFGLAALAALALGGCLTDQVVERPPGRGIAEVSESDPGAAQANIDSLSDVIRRNPSSPEAYNTRGSAYARLGHFQEAVDDFTQAIRMDPNNFTAYTNRNRI